MNTDAALKNLLVNYYCHGCEVARRFYTGSTSFTGKCPDCGQKLKKRSS